ncbi:MAG: hypothetical protein LIO45_00890 [Clostridiales bacterium]|nr:hypothetical protein [Clostridiales bacterium]
MADNLKVTLNRSGVRQLLRSQEMMNLCTKYAYTAQAKLGDGYGVTYRTGKNRVNAEVGAISEKAIRENLENNTILKALRSDHD